jgi:hypothetical protein
MAKRSSTDIWTSGRVREIVPPEANVSAGGTRRAEAPPMLICSSSDLI